MPVGLFTNELYLGLIGSASKLLFSHMTEEIRGSSTVISEIPTR